jgi:serine/threonine protein kinase
MLLSLQQQDRFVVQKILGEGSFSKLFAAHDNLTGETVALKVEKTNKSKKVLQFEYQVLKSLQGNHCYSFLGLSCICPVYEFIESRWSRERMQILEGQ